MGSLDDILQGATEEQTTVLDTEIETDTKTESETEAETETKTEADQGDATGETKAEDAAKESATPAPKDELKTVPMDALLDERRKRQELEHRLQALEAGKPAEEDKPSFFEDPEAALKNLRQEIEAGRIDDRVNLSVEFAKSRHDDFEDVMGKAWPNLVRSNPEIMNAAAQSPNPGEYAYQACKRALVMQEVGGDPAAFRQKIYDEAFEAGKKAALEEKVAQAEKDAALQESLPESLAGERSAGSRSGPAWGGPTPLDNIVGGTG